MRTLPARRLAIASLVLALLWILSCSDDESCPTCPTPPTCHDPSKALLGPWIVFESTVNGTPTQEYVGLSWDFRANDTLWVNSSTLYNWSANDTLIYMIYLPSPSLFYAFYYSIESDTLTMRSEVFIKNVYWKLHRTP